MKEQRDLVVCSKLLRILDSTYSSNRLSTNYTTIERKLDIAAPILMYHEVISPKSTHQGFNEAMA